MKRVVENNAQLLALFISLILVGGLLVADLVLAAKGWFDSFWVVYLMSILSLLLLYVSVPLLKASHRRWAAYGLGVWTFLFVLNIVLNMSDIYNLDRFSQVAAWCSNHQSVCHQLVTLFYAAKVHRFITLQAQFFFFPAVVLAGWALNINLKKILHTYSLPKKIFLATVALLVVSNIAVNTQVMYLSLIQSFQVLEEDFYSRFTFKLGGASYYGWIRVYSDFILESTPSEARLLIPPQSNTYKMEGNRNYFRWFLYPRQLPHQEDLSSEPLPSQVEYVVISAGECDDDKCVWPDFSIPADQIDSILLIDRETQQRSVLTNQPYLPEEFYRKWGLIKLRSTE